MKCQICDKEQTIRSMAMHLKWKHNLKTEEYVSQYGEFRPKFIKQNQIKQNSSIKCFECGVEMMNNKQLMHHIAKIHPHISQEEYIVKHFFNNVHPVCKCGCGQNTEFLRHGKNDNGEKAWFREYIKGHWDWIKPGHHKHSDKTKEQMRNSALKRIEKGINPWHTKEALFKKNKNNWDKIQNRIKNQHNVVCLNPNYETSMTQQNEYNFECFKCGYKWSQISFYPNCQKCHPPTYFGSSLEEKELVNFIKEYSGNVVTNSRLIIPPYELDIYLPNHKIAIEYNGLFWHSEKCGKYKNYHLDKLNLCIQNDIKLIQIFSDEWINHKDIVKSRIKNLLNLNEIKIFARKCTIKEITPQTKNLFLTQNHIQGNDKSIIKLGLYYGNELVSVMTFGQPRVGIGATTKNSWELVRFCNKINYQVVGGASKLLKYFIKTYSPKNIYSFADRRWSSHISNVYQTLGFKLKTTSNAGYWYTKDFLVRLHRFNFNKGVLAKMGCDISKTEFEIMDSLGYTRIWDCGTLRYELEIV